MKELRAIFDPYVLHRRQCKLQRSAFDMRISTLEEGTVLLVCDFQEKMQWGEQDEVQSQHWQKQLVTIFPCPIFFKYKGRVWAYSFQVLSDDLSQDNAWVQHVLSELLDKHIPKLLKKYGAHPMARAAVWSDNCGPQSKNSKQFGYVADCGVKVRDDAGRRGLDTVRLEHHYFASGHGKNFSDSEGAVTKMITRRSIINGTWVVSGARDVCNKLAAALNFDLKKPKKSEKEAFSARKKHQRGTGQILVTKVGAFKPIRSEMYGAVKCITFRRRVSLKINYPYTTSYPTYPCVSGCPRFRSRRTRTEKEKEQPSSFRR